MKLEITKRTVILSSRKKVCKGSRTQFLLFVSLLQSSFPLTTELEGSLIVFFGTNTFFCFTQKIASFTVDEDKRVDIKQISIAAFWLVVCTIMQFSLSFGGESGLDSLNTLIRRKTGLDKGFRLALASHDIIHQKYNGRSLNVSSVEFLKGNRLVKG